VGSGPALMSINRVESSAPGKLVLSGEYAVLAGAKALVAAVDRRVVCLLHRRNEADWSFKSRGYFFESSHTADELFRDLPDEDPARFIAHLSTPNALPRHAAVTIDSSPFYLRKQKLGIGSSAAVTVALGNALAALDGHEMGVERLQQAHRTFQRGVGSGLDVAAAYRGGVILYQNNQAETHGIDPNVHYGFVFAGESTQTPRMIARFNEWRGETTPASLAELVSAANGVVEASLKANAFMSCMKDYIGALVQLDQDAQIGIFGPGHKAAMGLAERHGVLYKPCGAGGGDMGVAFSTEDGALTRFKRDVEEQGLNVVRLEIEDDGVQVRTG